MRANHVSKTRLLRGALVVVVLVGGGFVAGFEGLFGLPSIDIQVEARNLSGAERYEPDGGSTAGPQIVMVYFGSSGCAYSNDPALPEQVEAAKVELRQRAAEVGASFSAIGVAVDASVEDGLDHLAGFGLFDEVIVGNRWVNHGALVYAWGELAGRTGTPSIIVAKRVVQVPARDTTSSGEGTYDVSEHQLLARKLGLVEIRRWADNGFPIGLQS